MKDWIQGNYKFSLISLKFINYFKRQDGLIWIIRAINSLGSKVILSSLPNFLDEEAIKFLFIVKYLIE